MPIGLRVESGPVVIDDRHPEDRSPDLIWPSSTRGRPGRAADKWRRLHSRPIVSPMPKVERTRCRACNPGDTPPLFVGLVLPST
jgi:hypothetical protein